MVQDQGDQNSKRLTGKNDLQKDDDAESVEIERPSPPSTMTIQSSTDEDSADDLFNPRKPPPPPKLTEKKSGKTAFDDLFGGDSEEDSDDDLFASLLRK